MSTQEQNTPTAQQVLEKHCPVFNALFADESVKRLRVGIIEAMEEYSRNECKRVLNEGKTDNHICNTDKTTAYIK